MASAVIVPVLLSACERLLRLHPRQLVFIIAREGEGAHVRFRIHPLHPSGAHPEYWDEFTAPWVEALVLEGKFIVLLPGEDARRFKKPIVDCDDGHLVLRSTPRVMTKLEDFAPPA